jgi:hypothetical protein
MTVGYVSGLEHEARQPKGPALALPNTMRRIGALETEGRAAERTVDRT